MDDPHPSYFPSDSPTQIIKPDIDIDTFRSTAKLAALAFALIFLLYSCLRNTRWARKVYTPRMYTARIPPRLPPSGIVSWILSLGSKASGKRLLDEVGLDAFMLNRILIFFLKSFACIVPLSCAVLIPLYASQAPDEEVGFTRYTFLALIKGGKTTGNIEVVVAIIWWNTLTVLYFLSSEYRMYIKYRHAFLRRQAPQSYTVLVERIPKQLCSESALLHYFRKIFGDRVLSAHVVDNNTLLNYAINQRLKVVELLEDSLLALDRTNKRPWRIYFPWLRGQIKQNIDPLGTDGYLSVSLIAENESSEDLENPESTTLVEEEQQFLENWHLGNIVRENVSQSNQVCSWCRCVLWYMAKMNIGMYIDKIESYEHELRVWNNRVKHLQRKADTKRRKKDEEAVVNVVNPSKRVIREQLRVRARKERSMHTLSFQEEGHSATCVSFKSNATSIKSEDSFKYSPWDDGRNAMKRELIAATTAMTDDVTRSVFSDSEFEFDDDDAYYVTDNDEKAIFERAGLDDILRYAVDQNTRTSAFVTFSSLTATNCAAQTVIDQPLKMNISLAPDIRDVLWDNLGLPLVTLSISTWIIRFAMIALILIFGTFSAFLAGLTNLNSLRHSWPWLDGWLRDTKHEHWMFIFQQVGPLCLVFILTILPPIINVMLRLQRRRSLSEIQVEFFQIYYYFLLIQVFLFYTFTGGILSMLHVVEDGNPVEILTLLGKALPSQELFFLQYLITRCALLAIELLRLSDLFFSFLRGMLKRSRTARARRNLFCGMNTIDNPCGGHIERTVATITLMFTIGICYSVMCPITTCVSLLYAAMGLIVYRNQLLYVYTHERESGGLLFPHCFRALILSVIIFHITMIGLFISTGNPSAVTFCLPLLVISLSFLVFTEKAYERSSKFLPLGDASELDIITATGAKVIYKHPSTLAPAILKPEPVDEAPYDHVRRASFSAAAEPYVNHV